MLKNKKEILSNATENLGTMVKKSSMLSRFGYWFNRRMFVLWTWVHGMNKLAFFNIVLLGLVVSMLYVMLSNVKTVKTVDMACNSNIQKIATAVESDRPTVVVSRNVLPIRFILPNEKPKFARKSIDGTLVIDGRTRGMPRFSKMTTVNGNLILQNIQTTYTLPCGTKVNGDLLLRNVKLLKFCGNFDITGNIYVSSTSSFGPIPRNAKLGGQVIF